MEQLSKNCDMQMRILKLTSIVILPRSFIPIRFPSFFLSLPLPQGPAEIIIAQLGLAVENSRIALMM